jgi:hypothetical protein
MLPHFYERDAAPRSEFMLTKPGFRAVQNHLSETLASDGRNNDEVDCSSAMKFAELRK